MKLGLVPAVLILAAAGATWWLHGDHAVSAPVARAVGLRAPGCSAAQLTRDEAVHRAEERLGKFSASLGLHERFAEPSARFDDDSKSWIVTFRNPECMVMMVVDRCKRDDLGGTTDCHAG